MAAILTTAITNTIADTATPAASVRTLGDPGSSAHKHVCNYAVLFHQLTGSKLGMYK